MREIKFRAWDKNYSTMKSDKYAKKVLANFTGDYSRYFELMQFTGLKDKNGVEIYEGDIVQDEYVKSVIVFGEAAIEDNEMYSDNDVVGFYRQGQDGEPRHLDYKRYPMEVIGNIYENHELLEANQ